MSSTTRLCVAPLVVALAAALFTASPAHAAAVHDVADEGALRLAAATTPAGDTIRLTADIGSSAARVGYLAFESSATLDLNGFALATQSIALKPGIAFAIDDLSASGAGVLDATYVDQTGVPYTPSAAISTTGAHLTIAGGNVSAEASSSSSRAGIGGYPTPAAVPQGVTIAGGTVDAKAFGGAAIGTSQNDIATGDFPIQISGGSVTARSNRGAGIGSAGLTSYARPTITVIGGEIVAKSITGAGIGGGSRASAPNSINVSDILIGGDAVVDARSTQAAGIGGGDKGSAKSLTVGAGADVTAFSGSTLVPAVGAGLNGPLDGTLTVHGTLRIPANSFVRSKIADPLGSVVNTIGATGTVTGEGGLRAQGVWNNSGAITMPDALITAQNINENHFRVALNGNRAGASNTSTRVFASTFTRGDRSLPSLAPVAGWSFTGWNTSADGTGDAFTADTVMVTKPEVGGVDGTAVSLYAQWAPARIEIAAASATQTAGVRFALTAACIGQGDAPLGDCTDDVTFTSSVASDVVTGASVLATESGERTLTGTGWGLSATDTAAVTPASATSLQLSPSESSVAQFGELSFVSVLLDAYGNVASDASSTATLSSVPTGVTVAGDRVTFPRAGSVTIRSTQGLLSATTEIEVSAAPVASIVLSAPPSAEAGDTLRLSAEGFAAGGQSLGDFSDEVIFTSSEVGDIVDGDRVIVSRAGSRAFTAALSADAGVTASASSTVLAGEIARLSLQASTLQVSQGSSAIFTSTAIDAFGNETDVSGTAVLSSDHPRDVIEKNTVTFPSASPHVITATSGDQSASVTITVIPTPGTTQPDKPSALSQTGTNSSFALSLGTLLLVLGGGVAAVHLVRRGRARLTQP